MKADDEANITEIEVLPDGRDCVFGTSAEVLAVLDKLHFSRQGSWEQRLGAQPTGAQAPAEKFRDDTLRPVRTRTGQSE